MEKFNRYLPFALAVAFFLVAFNVFLNSKPEHRNKRVYSIVSKYSPYYIEKRFGGLRILSKEDKEFKEEPSNESFFKELQSLEQKWAKDHLKIDANTLLILNKDKKVVQSIPLKNKDEIEFVHNYYGVQ